MEAVIENPGLMPDTREGINALALQDVTVLGVWQHPTWGTVIPACTRASFLIALAAHRTYPLSLFQFLMLVADGCFGSQKSGYVSISVLLLWYTPFYFCVQMYTLHSLYSLLFYFRIVYTFARVWSYV